MTNEERTILHFCWENPQFTTIQPSLKVNLWGDILRDGKIIAESDLHGLPLESLGTKLPKTWRVVNG